MYDCRTQGGHFFLSHPNLTALFCHHCSAKLSRPYRCILEKCGYLACDTCSTSLNANLQEFHKSRELAVANGLPAPSPPAQHHPDVPAPGDPPASWSSTTTRPRRGTVESSVSTSTVGMITVGPGGGETAGAGDGGGGGGPSTLGIGIIEVDDNLDDEEYEPPKRPFTRSAAMAAALSATRQSQGRIKTNRVDFRSRVNDGGGAG